MMGWMAPLGSEMRDAWHSSNGSRARCVNRRGRADRSVMVTA
jgi:hypothetical protein